MAWKVPVGVYDLDRLATLFFSVENTVAMAKALEGRWTPTDMGPLINGLYWAAGAIGTVKPGSFELHSAGISKMEIWGKVRRDLITFLDKTARSPTEGGTFLHGLMNQRNAARARINGLTASAVSINKEVAGQARDAANTAAEIQFASAVVGAGIGLALTVGAAGPVLVRSGAQMAVRMERISLGMRAKGAAIGLGGNVAGSLAADLAGNGFGADVKAGSVEAIGQSANNVMSVNTYKMVVVESTKKLLDVGVGKGSYAKAHANAALLQETVHQAQARVKLLQKAVQDAAEARARTAARVNLMSGKVRSHLAGEAAKTAHAATQKAGYSSLRGATGAAAHHALPVIFFAWDVCDAYNNLQNAYADNQ